MSNIITIELCAEDRARLDRIAGLLEAAQPLKLFSTLNACTALPEERLPEIKQQEEPAAPAEDTAPAPASEPAKEEKPTHTLADVRALAQTLLAPGSSKRAQTKETITAYAEKISDIPADKVDEVWQKLTELREA